MLRLLGAVTHDILHRILTALDRISRQNGSPPRARAPGEFLGGEVPHRKGGSTARQVKRRSSPASSRAVRRHRSTVMDEPHAIIAFGAITYVATFIFAVMVFLV